MHHDLLSYAESLRVRSLSGLDAKRQESLGQFFTPARAAALIASMPKLPATGGLRVLDPGAGSGMLSAALVSRVLAETTDLAVHVVAVEVDETMTPHLLETLEACKAAGDGRITFEVVPTDFIQAAATGSDARLTGFDLVVQNPPYSKLAASAPLRKAVQAIGVDVPNLYAAFLALGAQALEPGGQLVAITPRSFFNGPYFGDFRRWLLETVTLDRVHVFESRSTVFADTGVLQENIILSATKAGDASAVMLSGSAGHEDDAYHRTVDYADVVHPDDPNQFIRLAVNEEDTTVAEQMLSLPHTLASLGVTVSTGRVVDFRSRPNLKTEAVQGAFPLVYPGNLRAGQVVWPREIRKAQWYLPVAEADARWLIPGGWYCVTKRFSAKEERRRIVAAVWSPEAFDGPVAMENHLNYFHIKGAPLDRDLACGLSTWLNSTLVDKFFRTFSGHTQVNATDLRTLRFPSLEALRDLGTRASVNLPEQETLDALVGQTLGLW